MLQIVTRAVAGGQDPAHQVPGHRAPGYWGAGAPWRAAQRTLEFPPLTRTSCASRSHW